MMVPGFLRSTNSQQKSIPRASQLFWRGETNQTKSMASEKYSGCSFLENLKKIQVWNGEIRCYCCCGILKHTRWHDYAHAVASGEVTVYKTHWRQILHSVTHLQCHLQQTQHCDILQTTPSPTNFPIHACTSRNFFYLGLGNMQELSPVPRGGALYQILSDFVHRLTVPCMLK